MMTTWMTWALLVAALLAASAWLAESALRERGWPTRWPWLAAVIGSVSLPVIARIRTIDPAAGGAASEGWTLIDPAWLTEMSAAAAATVPSLGERIDGVLLGAWIVTGLIATATLLGGLAMLRSRASRWHRARVQGESVLLSRDFGPALVGVIHPEIVLPRWALRMSEEDQRLACLHEAEHRTAHDTWLLLAGAVGVALMPWNVVLWWQLRRLRGAVEVDCDARVLRRGASKRAYGALLLQLGSARGRSPLPVLALARSESLLERRLKMIVRNVRDRRPMRAFGAACLSAAVFAVACETEPPMTVEGVSEATAEASFAAKEVPGGVSGAVTGTLSPLTSELWARVDGGEARFYIDGEERDGVPTDLDATAIDRVEVQKNQDGTAAGVFVFTKRGAEAAAGGTIRLRGEASDDDPLIYVDEIRIEGGLSELDPEGIERVEVLKGEMAKSLYGPEAANGVIRITLKKLEGGTERR